MRWPRYWSFSFSIIPSKEIPGLISFRMDIANKGPSSQGYGFSSGHVWMWELDCEERWVLKNWCFWTVVLEKTLENPLEIQPVHSKGDQSWVFFGRNDAEAETPVLWPPHVKSWLIGKDWWWEGLGARGEGDDRGWDGWMASMTRWTWVWVNSGSWWWTGRPGVLWFMGSQRVGHDWVTDLIWSGENMNSYDNLMVKIIYLLQCYWNLFLPIIIIIRLSLKSGFFHF